MVRSRSANVRVLVSSRHAGHDSIVQATYLDILLQNIEGLGRSVSAKPREQRQGQGATYQVGHNDLGGSDLVGGAGGRCSTVGRATCVRSDRGVCLLGCNSSRALADTASGSSRRGGSLSAATGRAGTGSEDLVERTIEVERHSEVVYLGGEGGVVVEEKVLSVAGG